jgi:hypothetical protein
MLISFYNAWYFLVFQSDFPELVGEESCPDRPSLTMYLGNVYRPRFSTVLVPAEGVSRRKLG